MSNEEVEKIYENAEREYENLKDKVHDQYFEIERLNNIIKELEKELEKADSITQSCIFEDSRSAGKSYRQCLNWLEDYKSRNEKAIEYINHEIFKRTILVGVGTKKYTRNILDNVLNLLQGEQNE